VATREDNKLAVDSSRSARGELDRVRTDTTVVAGNVTYPTDSGLLARGVAKMGGDIHGAAADPYCRHHEP
jgi:hypothetical protein